MTAKKRTKKRMKKSKKTAFLNINAETLLKDDMFMSINDFQKRRVILPFLEDDEWDEEEEWEEEDEEGGEDEDERVEEEDEDERVEEEEERGKSVHGRVNLPRGQDRSYNNDPRDDFCGRECYSFNTKFPKERNDKCCVNCRKYLTTQCKYLDDFMDDVDGLEPD